jgi:hypothetical protein
MSGENAPIGKAREARFMLTGKASQLATSVTPRVGVPGVDRVGDHQETRGVFFPAGGAVATTRTPAEFGGADGLTGDVLLAEYEAATGRVYALDRLGQRTAGVVPWVVGRNISLLADDKRNSQGVVVRGCMFGDAGFDAHVYIAAAGKPGQAPITLHHDTPGAPQNSTDAYEGDGSRPAKLSDALRIGAGVDVLCQGKTASGPPAGPDWVYFNATKHGGTRNSGYLASRFAAADALLSHEGGGPLREASSLHDYTSTRDKRMLRRGALSIANALWTNGNPEYDAPLWLEEVNEPEDVMEPAGHATRVHAQFDEDDTHPHQCPPGKKAKKIKWHVRQTMPELPPCEGQKYADNSLPVVPQSYYAGQAMLNGVGFLSHPGA